MMFHSTSFRFTGIAACAALCCTALVARDAAEAPEIPLETSGETPKAPVTPEQRLVSVGQALAASNAELEALREQHAQLKLQMEALGIAAVKGDERSLQRRLLKATADLGASERARAEQTERTVRLAEAAAAFMADPREPALKTTLDEAIRAAIGAKQPTAAEVVSLDAARVVSYKDELGLAVVNAGTDSGLRNGTPLHIVRADKPIAAGLVVDVRDRIAGILLTGSTAATVRVGDSVKPDIVQTTPNQ